MNTPAHIILGAAAFGRERATVWGAVIGGVLPDLSLYVLAGTSLVILGIPGDVVFGELYYSTAWQTVFAIDNSFLVWGALLAGALFWRKPWAIALASAALLHLALDFPLHHDDGRAHFWPISGWVFESPWSYWDKWHGAQFVAPVEAALCCLALIVLIRARLSLAKKGIIAVVFAAEIWIVWTWLFVFAAP